MCGIVGWVDWDNDLSQKRQVLEHMTNTLRPRGPDAEGYYITPYACFGHRRLVVVDPLGGVQPMTRSWGGETFTLIYNGELYNTEDLRQELLAKGYAFTGHSDTEVLLVSYIEWGASCVDKLNGIYAFAVWQNSAQRLFLARDRMGVKPLFYTQQGTVFVFASELKALLAHPQVKPVIDSEGLAEIFGLGPARSPGKGVFRNIHEIRPGWCMELSRSGKRLWAYWRLESKPHTDDLPTTVEKVRWLVADAIKRQLVSDVSICTFLSGGLDSSTITAYAALAEKGRQNALATFSIDYVDNERFFRPNEFQPNSDAPWVERVASFLHTQHHSVYIDTPQLADALTDAVKARDLPGMADVDSSLLLFCRAIKASATVGLSGECADEVFGGYPWFHKDDALWADTFPWSRATHERAALLDQSVRAKVHLEDYVAQAYRDTLAEVPRLAGENQVESRRREMAYLNLWWFMQTLLDRKDRMSMATGLEVRVPFCDHRIVEYVWNVPWEMKAYGGREKGLVRAGLESVLPSDVIWRKKSPYPKTHNPNYTHMMSESVLRMVSNPHEPLNALTDTRVIRELAESGGAAFTKPWYGQLMTGPQLLAYLLQVNTWLREYKVDVVGV